LVVSFEFQEPFEEDRQTRWSSIGSAYSNGIISLNTAVRLLGITDKPDEEVEKILREAAEKKKISEKEHQPTS
jgi:predicted HTH domain antitoxin